jgi:peptide/nickel transport system permease protein
MVPSLHHWFGTDNNGADVFARVVYAARVDLSIGLASVGAAFVVGVLLGACVGNSRAIWASCIVALIDFMQSFPLFVLAMAFTAARGPSEANVIVVLTVLNVPIFVRLVRAETLALGRAAFIDAARCVGNSEMRLVLRHIVPNTLRAALAQLSISIGWALLVTAGLSFIGAGLQPPTPEWGIEIAQGADNVISGQWWVALFPGVALGLTVLSLSLAGDAVRDVLDVRRDEGRRSWPRWQRRADRRGAA